MLPVEIAIAPELKLRGFKKKARTWWRTTDDSIQVINLQKSAYGEALYTNLGIYVRSLGSELSPPEYRCHIRARLEKVTPDSLHLPIRCATAIGQPSEELLEALLSYGVGWLEALATPNGRRSLLGEASAAHWFVAYRVREA